MSSTAARTSNEQEFDELRLRIDLAAALRLAARFNWHESVGNHFSVAVSPAGRRFLMNPRWRHFALLKASELLLLDGEDADALQGENPPDPSAWTIHSQLHLKVKHARVVLHLHPPYATAVAALRDPTLLPIDQNTARFHGSIAQDLHYGGIADEASEGARLAHILGDCSVLMMGNHGVLVVGETIAEAFEDLHFLERACQTLILAYSTGQPLQVMTAELAARTARDWKEYWRMPFAHFEELKRMLDLEDPSYAR